MELWALLIGNRASGFGLTALLIGNRAIRVSRSDSLRNSSLTLTGSYLADQRHVTVWLWITLSSRHWNYRHYKVQKQKTKQKRLKN